MPHQEDAQRVQAALVHERAGHHLVVDEVAGQEPVVGVDVGLGADEAEAEPPAGRVDERRRGPPAAASRRAAQRVASAAAPRRPGRTQPTRSPAAQGLDLLARRASIAACGTRSRQSAGRLPGSRLPVERRLHDALAGGQRLGGEEAGDAVAHGHQRLAVHRAVEPEAEQLGVALAEELVDVDVVEDRLADARQPAVEASPRRRAGGRRPARASAKSMPR